MAVKRLRGAVYHAHQQVVSREGCPFNGYHETGAFTARADRGAAARLPPMPSPCYTAVVVTRLQELPREYHCRRRCAPYPRERRMAAIARHTGRVRSRRSSSRIGRARATPRGTPRCPPLPPSPTSCRVVEPACRAATTARRDGLPRWLSGAGVAGVAATIPVGHRKMARCAGWCTCSELGSPRKPGSGGVLRSRGLPLLPGEGAHIRQVPHAPA